MSAKSGVYSAAVLVVAFSVLALTLPRRAQAAIETCPAAASKLYPLRASGDAASLYAFDLTAPGKRAVQGNLGVWTDSGWYRVTIPETTFVPAAFHYHTPKRSWVDNLYASPVLYVEFPQPVHVLVAWLERAQATGDTVGWEKAGAFECYPPHADPRIPSKYTGPVLAPADLRAFQTMPPPGVRALEARPVAPFENVDCATPFSDATALHAVTPPYPRGAQVKGGVALIEVLIMPNGRAGDAWIFKSSGNAAYDDLAMKAAEASTYAPAIGFCKPTIGEYLYKVEYLYR